MRRILIIAYYFPPARAVGAKRAAALQRTFREKGYEVDVVAANWEGLKVDGVKYVGKELRQGSARPTPVVRGRAFGLGQYFRSLDGASFSSFVWEILKDLVKSRGTWRGRYDVVVASYKPACVVPIGIAISYLTGAKLILDFRDLMSACGRKKRVPILNKIDTVMDRWMARQATRIVTVTPTMKAKAERLYKRPVDLIYNGIDNGGPEPCSETASESTGPRIIFYSGMLSEDRHLGKICSYIRRLNDSSNIKLVVASRQDPTMFGGDQSVMEWIGFVSQDEAEQRQRTADFLLLLEGRTEDSIENIPAKLFEYLGTGRPVLADCHPESDSLRVLTETNAGVLVDSFEAFCQAMEGNSARLRADVNAYTRARQNQQYIDLIESLFPASSGVDPVA